MDGRTVNREHEEITPAHPESGRLGLPGSREPCEPAAEKVTRRDAGRLTDRRRYSSSAGPTRLRLFFLTGSLLLVLLLMERVRDPELWRRIGFGEQTRQKAGGWVEIHPGGLEETEHGEGPGGAVANPRIPEQQQSAEGESPPASTESGASPTQDPADQADSAVDEAGFWEQLLDRLPDDARLALAIRLAGRANSTAPRGAVHEAVRALDQQLQQDITRRLSALTSASAFAREAAARLSDLRIAWDLELAPWLEQVDDSGQAAAPPATPTPDRAGPFVRALRDTAWRRVVDRTGPARTTDGPAVLLTWSQLLEPATGHSAAAPAVFDLMTQPGRFRGQSFRVGGILRGIEPVRVQDHPLGLKTIWSLWVEPQAGSTVPVCIYSLGSPDGVVPDPSRFVHCRLPIQCDAVFVKLRTYTDTTGQVALCPFFLANQVSASGETAAGAGDAAHDFGRLPPPWSGFWLVPLVVLAVAVSWLAARTVRSGRRRPIPLPARAALRLLEESGDVLSDRQRVARMDQESTGS